MRAWGDISGTDLRATPLLRTPAAPGPPNRPLGEEPESDPPCAPIVQVPHRFYAIADVRRGVERRCAPCQACTFAHGPQELQPLPDLYKTQLCAFFIKHGRCRAGANCRPMGAPRAVRPSGTRTHRHHPCPWRAGLGTMAVCPPARALRRRSRNEGAGPEPQPPAFPAVASCGGGAGGQLEAARSGRPAGGQKRAASRRRSAVGGIGAQ